MSTQRYYTRPARLADIDAIRALEESIVPSSRAPQGWRWAREGLAHNPDSVIVLVAGRSSVCGATWCLPMKDTPVSECLRERRNLDELLDAGALLARDQALQRAFTIGNVCKVGMVAVEPRSGVEDYCIAVPLFVSLLHLFYKFGMRAVIAQTATEQAAQVLSLAGAEAMNTHQDTTMWYFDDAIALKHITSGLAVVYFSTWAMPGVDGVLKLTRTERELVLRAMHGSSSNKELARDIGLGHETIKTHWRNILRKATEAKIPGCAVAGRRTAVMAFCRDHPEEIGRVPTPR